MAQRRQDRGSEARALMQRAALIGMTDREISRLSGVHVTVLVSMRKGATAHFDYTLARVRLAIEQRERELRALLTPARPYAREAAQ